MKNSTEGDLSLKHMPRHLIMECDLPWEVQCQGLPENHFPMKKGNADWDSSSYPREQCKMKTESFSVIPYFSSIIDSITGKEVEKAKFDTGDWRDSITL